MKPMRHIIAGKGRRRFDGALGLMTVMSFGLNPRPNCPSYAWLDKEGVTGLAVTAREFTAVGDFSLSQH